MFAMMSGDREQPKSIRLPEFYFTMFDIDHNVGPEAVESLSQSSMTAAFVTKSTELRRSIENGEFTVTATAAGTGDDNPTDPADLSSKIDPSDRNSKTKADRSITYLCLLYTSPSPRDS